MVGKIYISGTIGSFGEEKGIELVDVISQVRKQPEATSFEVYINSEGGVVDTGFDIYNFLNSLGLPITTIGGGVREENFTGERIVASMGTVIFMAGHKRSVVPGTKFMIHLPMGGISFATAEEMEEHSKHMRDVENKVIGFYSKNLGLGKEAISPLLKNETWLSETQLQDLGFTTPSSDMKISARANTSKTKKVNKMSKKNRLQTILKAIFEKEVNKMIFTADEKELMFPDIAEDGVIEVGAKATLEGQPVGGTEEAPVSIVGADGKTYMFVDSMVKEIVDSASEVEEEEVTTDELIDALAATLEYTTELSGRVEAVETEVTGIKKERDEAVSKLKIAEATIAKLKGSSKSPEDDKKDKDKKAETISATVAQWRKNKTIKK